MKAPLGTYILPLTKALLIPGFIFFCCATAHSQNHIDSLETAYSSGSYNQRNKLNILKELAMDHPDPDKALAFSEALIQAARAVDSTAFVIQGLQEKGNALRLKSDLSSALESYFQAASLVGEETPTPKLGALYTGIGDVYSIMGNHQNGVKYHESAIRILRETKDSANLAAALLNTGDEYISLHRWDSALIYTEEAGLLYEKLQSPLGEGYSLGNLGMIYAQMGNQRQAEENMNEAILLLEQLDEHYPIAVYLRLISDIYLQAGNYQAAFDFAFRSLELAKRFGLKEQISDANLTVSQIYEQTGKIGLSFRHFKEHIAYKDSVKDIASVQQMANLRTDFELSRKQVEVDLLNQQKKNQQIIVVGSGIAFFLICLLAYGLYRRYQFIREANLMINKEKERSESLLLNILPAETARELKKNGKVQAQKFDSVTVMFADFKEFTRHAETMSPEKLVERVDFYFSTFDAIMEKYGLEKIKTIGDSYMCAGGLPFRSEDHAVRMTRAALEMMDFVKETRRRTDAQTFDIRIGINTGPVVAGVVGTRKFAYDIWGDTVNIASRLESSSEPGQINVSESTYQRIKDVFRCGYRGELDVKNKGVMKMYFVEGDERLAVG